VDRGRGACCIRGPDRLPVLGVRQHAQKRQCPFLARELDRAAIVCKKLLMQI